MVSHSAGHRFARELSRWGGGGGGAGEILKKKKLGRGPKIGEGGVA